MENHHLTINNTVTRLLSPESLSLVGVDRHNQLPLPSQQAIEEIVELARAIIFPGYFGSHISPLQNAEFSLGILVDRLALLLNEQIAAVLHLLDSSKDDNHHSQQAIQVTDAFVSALPELRQMLAQDADAIFTGDPAAVSPAEVIYCYPAIRAITNYRVAHQLYLHRVPIIPRMICEMAHRETGIDIHPGASIGRAFMIDHGTGVVIGETAIIGDNVKLYQGVTLGARSFPVDEGGNPVKGLQRHPIIGDNVIIYANSTILGRVTIGSDSIVGGNIWVTEDVAPGSIVLQARADNNIKINNLPNK